MVFCKSSAQCFPKVLGVCISYVGSEIAVGFVSGMYSFDKIGDVCKKMQNQKKSPLTNGTLFCLFLKLQL